MNKCQSYLESVSFLVAPYRDQNNVFSEVVNSSENVNENKGIKVFDTPNLKLKSYMIPRDTTGGTFEVVENNCMVPRYFLSQTDDVMINQRDAIGGFYDLRFVDKRHNFTANTNSVSNSALNTGTTVDITQEIRNFKTLHDVTDNYYIYFFCPFLKKDSESTNFKVKFNLNQNEYGTNIQTPTKDELENEVISANTGESVITSTSNEVLTVKKTWDDILAEVKDSTTSNTIVTKMTESVDGYYSIIERSLDLKVGKDNAPNIEMVKVLPPKGAIELIKLNSGNKKYYIRSDSEVTGYYYNPGAPSDGIVSFTNQKINYTMQFDSDTENYTVLFLLYSVDNSINMTNLQGTLTRVVSSSEGRLLQEDYDGTTLYISEDELNDDFTTNPGLEWYWILLIVLGILLLLLLLLLLICCCCCGKDENEPTTTQKSTVLEEYVQDTILTPNIKDKDSKGQVGYYTNQTTQNSGFTDDL